MGDLAGTAVRVTPERHQADEWAVVLAAGNIPHRLSSRLDGWALIVGARDAEAAREALDAYDRENIADTADAGADAVAPIRRPGGAQALRGQQFQRDPPSASAMINVTSRSCPLRSRSDPAVLVRIALRSHRFL